jgi:hypothetical protein
MPFNNLCPHNSLMGFSSMLRMRFSNIDTCHWVFQLNAARREHFTSRRLVNLSTHLKTLQVLYFDRLTTLVVAAPVV